MVSRDTYNVGIAVYMMASRCHGTIYIGVTSRFPGRIFEHRNGLIDGFTKKYGVHRLVWYEVHESILSAIQREKSLKKYKRDWKVNLIERENPDWDDLYPAIVGMRRARKTQTLAIDKNDSPKQP
ncbi:MAG TPA: GIY-YIG nuclease family protein [Rhizomicrobium sp.]|jgi:putative endonuclease|nr:GIY-YIG nuclease family protein [Rhizomicrobium sp.]